MSKLNMVRPRGPTRSLETNPSFSRAKVLPKVLFVVDLGPGGPYTVFSWCFIIAADDHGAQRFFCNTRAPGAIPVLTSQPEMPMFQ